MSFRFRGIICLLSVPFLTTPIWLPQLMAQTKINWYINSQSFFLTGCSLLVGLLFSFFPSDRLVVLAEKIMNLFRKQTNLFLFIVITGFLAAAYFVNQFALISFMSSGDEHSCYFLAECIRNGNFWATPHPLAEFFEVVHVGNKAGKWFSVYPPGWPLIFALGLELNLRDWTNPILSALSLLLFYHAGKNVFGKGTAFLAICFMSFTSFFLFNSASYFSHPTCLLSIALFLYAFVKWRESKKWAWASLAAFAVGYGLTTRYLTMAAVAAPFLLYELALLLLRRERFRSGHVIFSMMFAVAIVFNLYYNFLITGNLLEAPNHYYHSWERLGFHDDYTIFNALFFIVLRLFFLTDWIPGAFVVLFFIALMNQRKDGILQLLFRYGFFYTAIGYIFYYSWGGGQFGPRYYFEGLIFLFFAVSNLFSEWWKTKSVPLRNFSIGLIMACFVVNLHSLNEHVQFYHLVTTERKALYNLAESTAQKPAIVFIRGFLGKAFIMSEEDVVRNHPQLNEPILYAHDLGEKNKLLMEYYPNRSSYLGSYDRELNQPILEPTKI